MKNKIKQLIKRILFRNKDKYKSVSYSQCGEDLIINFIFNQLRIYKPTYLDIGAHHPYFLSNTALFYMNGCTGVNIEPDFDLFKEFETQRVNDINLNIGIGEKEDIIDFYIMDASTLNTFSKEQVELYDKEGDYKVKEVKKVPINTIQYVLQKYCNGIFPDLLSLDAEGIDELVLKSIDFSNKPKVICVETLSFSNSGKGVKNDEIITFLKQKGYFLYADTYINSIFVSTETWATIK